MPRLLPRSRRRWQLSAHKRHGLIRRGTTRCSNPTGRALDSGHSESGIPLAGLSRATGSAAVCYRRRT